MNSNTVLNGDLLRKFAVDCLDAYNKSLTVALPFNEWRATAFSLMHDHAKDFKVSLIKPNTHVAIAPSTRKMLKILNEHSRELEAIQLNVAPERRDYEITTLCKKLFVPELEFDYTPPTVPIETKEGIKDTPMWFNTTMKGINVRLGYDRGDSGKPSAIDLSDNVVHMMLGGATGVGKSVALNTAICNILLEYPPWEVDVYLGDFKKVEGARYANRIPTPHMKIVAATGSTEFILSMYNELIREMNDRQSLFVKTGVQKVEDFRNKFGLVMPRVILIVDEFTQQYENIKASEALGNDSAGEDKKEVDAALSAIARLGRSMGIHMLLSSQQLDSLDSGVANQFAAGVTLKASPAVSTSLIGNDAGASICGKGKGYYNMNKSAKNVMDNVLVRIPYLKSEQSDEEAASGKLTNLQEILRDTDTEAKKLNYKKDLVFYDEDAPIPMQKYEEALSFCSDVLFDRSVSEDIDDIVFSKENLVTIPLGPEIKLSEDPCVLLTLRYSKNQGIVVNALEPDMRNYIINLLQDTLQKLYPDIKHTVIKGSEAIFLSGGFQNIRNADIKTRALLPPNLNNKIQTRIILISLQDYLSDNGDGTWNLPLAVDYFIENIDARLLSNSEKTKEDIVSLLEIVLSKNTFDGIPELEGTGSEVIATKNVLQYMYQYIVTFIPLRNKGEITRNTFQKEVVWLCGLDSFLGIDDSDVKRQIKTFLENASTVGYIPIVTAETWTKVGSLVETCNFILERCDKTFFMDISLPKAVNANPNSFQLHNRLLKTRYIISKYSSLS